MTFPRVRTFARLGVVPTLACSGLCASLVTFGCTNQPQERQQDPLKETVTEMPPEKAALPDPLALPQVPRAAIYVADPTLAAEIASRFGPKPVSAVEELEVGLARITSDAWAEQLAPLIDPARPWGVVDLEQHDEILVLPLKEGTGAGLGDKLTALSRATEFGAVTLPAPNGGEASDTFMAWFDEESGTLAIARSAPGLVASRNIAGTYGKEPVFFTAVGENLELPMTLPIQRVTGHGDFQDLEIVAKLEPGSQLIKKLQLGEGSLGGLLGDDHIAVGGTSRWAGHEAAIKDVIRDVDQQVDQLPFLVKGMAIEVQRKLNSALRSWDGRVLLAVGDAPHVRLAYGSADPKHSGVAVTRLIEEVRSNIDVIRMFTSSVPKISLRKRVTMGGGEPVHIMTIANVKGQLPPDLHALLDDSGRLNVAMAWSERAGAGLFVVGPHPDAELAHWLDAVATAPTGAETEKQLGALTMAIPPEQVTKLATGAAGMGMSSIVELRRNGPRYEVQAERIGPDEVRIALHGPNPRPKRKELGASSVP